MNNYKIEILSENNWNLIYELYAHVYELKRPTLFYESKYNTNYVGIKAFGCVALLNGKAIGFVGIIPTKLLINGEEVIGGQLTDAMVNAEHRKKGVLLALLKELIVTAKNCKIKLAFVFPNQNSFHVLVNNLHFMHLHTMHSYTFNKKNNRLKEVIGAIFTIKQNRNLKCIENDLITFGYDGVLYSQEYLEYKKLNKNFIIESESYSVWLSHSKRTWIGAVSGLDKDNVQSLLSFVSKKFGGKSFTYMVSPNTELDALFSEILTPQKTFPVCIYDFTGNLDLSNLKFQFADSDVF